MRMDKVFIAFIFLASLIVAITQTITVGINNYLIALALFWGISTLYSHLKVVVKKGNTNIDYTIPYSLSMGLFAGPLGIFIFETLYRFTVYFNRKATNTADKEELLHTFYNVGSFALNSSIAFYLYLEFHLFFEQIPFGFWILIMLLVLTMSLLSDLYLIIIFSIMGDIKSIKGAIDFVKNRSILDMGKVAFSNGLLFVFLENKQWEMLVGLFVLNYLVSRSIVATNTSMQHKMERDKFEQMAYTDFLTEVYNRAFMDKKMDELNNSGEHVGIIVADIDTFKKINDTYNHAVGDRVIQHFAATLQSYLDDGDFLFRSGGEEFTIFLRNRDYHECASLVEKLQQGVASSPVNSEYFSEQITIHYTSSFGLYYYKTNENIEIQKAYVHADQLLFRAKELGKNKVSMRNGLQDLPLSVRYQI